MSKRAEQAALKAYSPKHTSGKRFAKRVQGEMVDTHAPIRTIFTKGYLQAEEDFALTAEDVRKIFNKVRAEAIKWNAPEACFPDVWYSKRLDNEKGRF